MSKHVGIPIKVLHDAEGHTVTIELKNGEVFRGKLDEAEDNMNCHLSNCTKTAKDGRVNTLANVFLRGSHVRFMVLPDILKNAPFFKKIETKSAKAAAKGGRAKQAATQRAAGRPTPGLPPVKGQRGRDGGGRNPSFN
uniref:Small nuclear ribonucleoprotein Sm D3 n=1 Tax=Haptolina ericina TaxID=156174 RepID=A0A7S3B4W5_9EUKA|mmetsp:Transcript_47791/g.107686  ORF Transcript_47791/g.107686 Transcript_47791/m.107686 type:complete len:138 (+) Transcript_47791:52-465(+)|eukprot:CAMPEP_0181195596 /NCGR_PEP_ID=MMETSP1096-20121128/14978_1 /TAXON_ID=156174 ORGANISM="Chrysochromulina ericina, Strain CCMP281" /NCGR_SAMPLE_ID=MMETSP1096 /ASSEMBLY_ACC=CAM_ASM_000453 /LENGTH=137 /DNA_ID=CAMNT_0023285223 /DNA_START=52 /DNA_END=465 /DNA_ORIENTATION=-